MMSKFVWFHLVCCCLLVGCTSTSGNPFAGSSNALIKEAEAFRQVGVIGQYPRELAKTLVEPQFLEPGDILLVTISDLDSEVRIPADQPIQVDGTIDLGTYGELVVAGLTVASAEQAIRQAVQKIEKDAPEIQVRLISQVSKVIYVLGEVNAPGAFPFTGRETALDAIIEAGGLSSQASQKSIILSRPTDPQGCRLVMPICYQQIVQLGDTKTNYQLRPGDRIFVPAKDWKEEYLPFLFRPSCACTAPQVQCTSCAPAENVSVTQNRQ